MWRLENKKECFNNSANKLLCMTSDMHKKYPENIPANTKWNWIKFHFTKMREVLEKMFYVRETTTKKELQGKYFNLNENINRKSAALYHHSLG